MSVLTEYKGLDVVENASGAGGIALTENFKSLADRAPYEASSAPSATDDSGKGFAAGDHWLDTSTQIVWICTSAGIGAATWKTLVRRTASVLELIPMATGDQVSIPGMLRCGFDPDSPNQNAQILDSWFPRTANLENGWSLDYQDEFALIDRKGASVTVTPAFAGSTANLFVDNRDTIDYSIVSNPGTVQITIDCTGAGSIPHRSRNLYAIGLTFRSSSAGGNPNPTHIKIEYFNGATPVTQFDEKQFHKGFKRLRTLCRQAS